MPIQNQCGITASIAGRHGHQDTSRAEPFFGAPRILLGNVQTD